MREAGASRRTVASTDGCVVAPGDGSMHLSRSICGSWSDTHLGVRYLTLSSSQISLPLPIPHA